MSPRVDPVPQPASRVLYITHAPPLRSRLGPARRHYHVLDQLARLYDVHLLTLGERSEADAIRRDLGERVSGFTAVPWAAGRRRRRVRKLIRTIIGRCDFLPSLDPGLRAACERVAAVGNFDAIVLSSVLMRSLPLPVGVSLIADTHNVDFDVLRRTASQADRLLVGLYARRQWPATRDEERRGGEGVDLLLATSVRDRQVFESELGLRNVAVVPNGIDPIEFSPSCRPPIPGTILFTGLMSYYPNQHAIKWFLTNVLPLVLRRRADARLVVAGAAPPRWLSALADGHVHVTGPVPDIRPYLERAEVVVAPLMIGGGTRVKILEALAMERPVVSTTIGAEGLDLADGVSVLFADEPSRFAARILDVLLDPRLAAQLGRCGRQHVMLRFDWNRIGEAAGQLLATRLGLVGRGTTLAESTSGQARVARS